MSEISYKSVTNKVFNSCFAHKVQIIYLFTKMHCKDFATYDIELNDMNLNYWLCIRVYYIKQY